MAATLQQRETILIQDIQKVKENINLDLAPESIYCIVYFLAYSSAECDLTCNWLRVFETFLNAGKEGHSAFNAGLLATCHTYLYEGDDRQKAKFELLKREFPVIKRAIRAGEERGLDLITTLEAAVRQSLGGKDKATAADELHNYIRHSETIAWQMHQAFKALERTQASPVLPQARYQPTPRWMN